jgi:predicted ArsR family transcriptional regulator
MNKPPETSIEAFKSLEDCEIKKTYEGILNALAIIKEGNFEDIAKAMKCKPDKVWKRLSELHEKYMLIYRPGGKKLLKSGRKGFVWKLTDLGIELSGANVSVLPGKTIQDFSRAINQVKQSTHTIERLF